VSSAKAIAAVTAVLKDLLHNGMIDHDVMDNTGGPIKVSTLPPDLIETDNKNLNQLNLFLYQVSPNQGWRNMGLPSRDSRGELTENPPLALNLHYMLTAYSSKDLYSEILLGYAMQLLHEMPALTKELISMALEPEETQPGDFPTELRNLNASDLTDQIENIRITPNYLSTDEMSKLWSALQSKYRPTVAYLVSVVLIQSQKPKRSPLPVLKVGPDNRGIISQATTTTPFPALIEVKPPNRQASAKPGDALTLLGRNLDGSDVRVRFVNPKLKKILESSSFLEITGTKILVKLDGAFDTDQPTVSDSKKIWSAGSYSVTVLVQKKGETYYRTTNELPFSLAPTIINYEEAAAGGQPTFISVSKDTKNNITFHVRFAPEVRHDQKSSLIVGDHEIPAEPHIDLTQNTLKFIAKSVSHGPLNLQTIPPGIYYVRLRVDGVESILIDCSSGTPEFDEGQKVTVP
jgi:hypothetical protein